MKPLKLRELDGLNKLKDLKQFVQDLASGQAGIQTYSALDYMPVSLSLP